MVIKIKQFTFVQLKQFSLLQTLTKGIKFNKVYLHCILDEHWKLDK